MTSDLGSILMIKFIILLFLFVGILPCYCVELTFDDAIEKSLKNFYDIKISKIESEMANQSVNMAQSDYFPKLEFASNLQYDRNLADEGSITSVGGDVLLNRSLYQNSVFFGLGYNLFDFGIRKRSLDIAKLEKKEKYLNIDKIKRDTCLKVADLYVESLIYSKEIDTKAQILENQKKLLGNKSRLTKEGLSTLIDVFEEDVKSQDLKADIDFLKSKLKRNLKELSFYTNEPYKLEKTVFRPFRESKFIKISSSNERNQDEKTKAFALSATVNDLKIEETPEFKIYQLEIDKKQKEIEIAKREKLPKLKTYGGYYLYGTDNGDLINTFDSLKKKNWMLRLQLTHSLFDGFKKRHEIKELILEKEKLEFEKQKEIEILKVKYNQLKEKNFNARNQIKIRSKILALVEKQIDGLERLYSQKLIKQNEYLEEKQELLKKKFELEKTIITCLLELYKVNLLTGGY